MRWPLVFLVALVAFGAFVGCDGEDENPSPGHGGQGGDSFTGDTCCELGAICHTISDDTDQAVRECHNLGHRNDEAACEERFEECKDLCAGKNPDPVPHSCD